MRLVPFLDRMAVTDPAEHARVLADLLGRPAYAQVAARLVFAISLPPVALLDVALAAVEASEKAADVALVRSEVPVATMARLLRHINPQVRAMAALSEWLRRQPPDVRPELLTDWRVAALDVAGTHHHLEAIFAAHPDVALAWARASIRSAETGYDLYAQAQGCQGRPARVEPPGPS